MKPEGPTVIGRSVTIIGRFSAQEDVSLDCVVEGSISLPQSRLTIGPNGRVKADIEAQDVVIYGSVEGNVHASGRIELREAAVLQGDIVASRLSIEENTTVKGKVELLESSASRPASGAPAQV
ncbi:MAG: polymer-forming cytoskeletal protein [Acidobacteriota bacterium]|nr:polymer-forming cytoskeletal protein [Acidobacteriota bacterium]